MDPTSIFDFEPESDYDSDLDFEYSKMTDYPDSDSDVDVDYDLIEETLHQLQQLNFINLKMTYHTYTKHGPLEFDSEYDSDSD
jgi:hypothetical protein